MTQTANRAVFPPRLQSQYPQRLWYDHTLLLVIRWWDTFENLETLHCGRTTGGLVRDHATDGFVEYSGRSAEMEWTY